MTLDKRNTSINSHTVNNRHMLKVFLTLPFHLHIIIIIFLSEDKSYYNINMHLHTLICLV